MRHEYKILLLRYVIIATVIYLIWIPIADAYSTVLIKANIAYFKLIGYTIYVHAEQIGSYNRGMFSCIPPFIALVLATPKLEPLKRMGLTAVISSIIFLIDVISLIVYIYYTYIYLSQGLFYQVFISFIQICNVTIPFLVWFWFAFDFDFGSTAEAKTGRFI